MSRNWTRGIGLAVALTCAVGCSGRSSQSPDGPRVDGTGQPRAEAGPAARQAVRWDPLHPVVRLQTSLGEITVQLDAENAPLTVRNFLDYVVSGQYNGTVFHEVHDSYVILGGNYNAELTEQSGHIQIRNEADNGLKNRRGTIAMARRPDSIDSATRMFFINLADNPALDFASQAPEGYGYCVFGHVTAGMEIADRIGQAPVESRQGMESVPRQAIVIQSMTRLK